MHDNSTVSHHVTEVPPRLAPGIRIGVPLAVLLITALVFAPSLGHDFVNWDDEDLLQRNTAYRGLSPAHLRWMLTAMPLGHWAPLTWLTFATDHAVWGMNPMGYHLTNVVLHVATVAAFGALTHLLLRLAAPSLDARAHVLGAAAAALWFAVHPLRAESVAWITERRDVLSGLWIVATVYAYVRAAVATGRRRVAWLAASVLCFALAVTSKTIAMVVPVALVLLDVYPLRRLTWDGRGIGASAAARWGEKLPFIALALVAAALAAYGQRDIARSLDAWPLAKRIPVAIYGTGFYLRTTLVPTGLSPLYELSRLTPAMAALSGVPVALLLAAAWRWHRRRPWLAVTLGTYLACIAPVSGLTQAGPQLVALRYSYLAALPLAVLLGAGVAHLVQRWIGAPGATRTGRWGVIAASGVYMAALTGLTLEQVAVWRNSETLWRQALAVDHESPIAHNNLGTYYAITGRPAEGERHIRRALILRSGYELAYRNLGVLGALKGLDEQTRIDVGLSLVKEGRYEQAAEIFAHAIAANPEDATAHNNMGVVRYAQGDYDAAIAAFERALELNPEFDEARNNMVAARMKR